MGGTESLTCWEIAPALINQGAVSPAPDIYQTSFTLTCQCAVRLPLQGSLIKSEAQSVPGDKEEGDSGGVGRKERQGAGEES